MGFPWISREHHLEVIAAKDELIRSLQVQNAVLAARLEEPITVTVKLPEDFAVLQPAFIRRKKPKVEGQGPAKPVEIDWAAIDESNPAQIAEIAARELGDGYTPYQLAGAVKRIRLHIRSAKAERARNQQDSGRVGIIETEVPERVRQLITEAEGG